MNKIVKKVVLRDEIPQKIENTIYEPRKYYLVSEDFITTYSGIFKVIGQFVIENWAETPIVKKEINDISEIIDNKRTALIILNNENSIEVLEEYGSHNIPEKVDTFCMDSFYTYCKKSNWWPTYYCIFDENTKNYKNDILEITKNTSIKKFFTYDEYISKEETNDKIVLHNLAKPFMDYLNNECTNNEINSVKIAIELGYKKIIIVGIDSYLNIAEKSFWEILAKQVNGKGIEIIVCGDGVEGYNTTNKIDKNSLNYLTCFEHTSLEKEFGEKNKQILTFFLAKNKAEDVEIIKKLVKKTFKDLEIFDLTVIEKNSENMLNLEKYKNFIRHFKINDENDSKTFELIFNKIKSPYIMLLNNNFDPSTRFLGNIISLFFHKYGFDLEKNYLTIIDNYNEIGYIFKTDYFKDNIGKIVNDRKDFLTVLEKSYNLIEKKIWFVGTEKEEI